MVLQMGGILKERTIRWPHCKHPALPIAIGRENGFKTDKGINPLSRQIGRRASQVFKQWDVVLASRNITRAYLGSGSFKFRNRQIVEQINKGGVLRHTSSAHPPRPLKSYIVLTPRVDEGDREVILFGFSLSGASSRIGYDPTAEKSADRVTGVVSGLLLKEYRYVITKSLL